MRVVPRQPFAPGQPGNRDPAGIIEIPGDASLDGDLFIECEVMDPPSRAGGTVYLHVPAEQVPALLKAAKRSAIEVRR